MARQTGLNNFSGTLEVLAGGPLDARTIVATKADLTTSGNFVYAYVGMIVSVQDEGKAYILKDIDYTNIDNWESLGSAESSGGVVTGYYNIADDTFYYDIDPVYTPYGWSVNFIDPVIGEDNVIYVDKGTLMTYVYFSELSQYKRLDAYHMLQMPNLTGEEVCKFHLGRIVQFVNEDDIDGHKEGYFYKCIEDPLNPGTYIWKQIDVQPHGIPQCDTMPLVFGEYGYKEGDIVQYIGATDSSYTNGYFYKAVKPYPEFDIYEWDPIQVQSAGTDNVLEGYYSNITKLFYEDRDHLIPLPCNSNTLYISVTDNKLFRYDMSYRMFRRVDDNQKVSLPSPSYNELGNIYQYVGDTTADYTKGYFYECVSTGSSTYEWRNIDVQPAGGATGVVWDDIDGEYYLESSVTTTTGQPFSFTFTDAKLVPGATIDIFAGQASQTGDQTVYDYSGVSLSNGSCTISYPDAPSNATVTCRIYIK